MTNIIDSPPVYTLPLSKGRDLRLELIYKPMVVDIDGDPILDSSGKKQYAESNYPSGCSVKLVIDNDDLVESVATISGSHAVIHVDHSVVDEVPRGRFWRVIIRYSDGLDDVLVNGKTTRSDGSG